MASKKYLELQEFSDTDLAAELKAAEQEYQKMQFDHATKGVDNPLSIKEMRRDIARLNTEIRRREVASMPAEVLAKRSKIRARRRQKN
ncbi:MAG TPA: 50S ribosomal protein L29 [Saprospiraceae bacterium]|nr:50S ribosomal protein L29 [Saprospiraceae bacterium]